MLEWGGPHVTEKCWSYGRSFAIPAKIPRTPMIRDQPNSRFHGRDIFREIGLLP